MTNSIVPPPADRQQWHVMLKAAPLIVILLYMRAHQGAVTQAQLAEQFLIDRKTAGTYLRQMSNDGLIAHIGHNRGYVTTDGGAQMLLALEETGWGKNGHPTLKESFNIKTKDSKDRKEGKKEMGNLWTVPLDLTIERILSETGRLFPHETISFGVAHCDPTLAFTLVAHAYDQRARLSKPQVFVYRRLQKGMPPDKKYQQDPEGFLPNEYLAALGLAELQIIDMDEAEEIAETPTASQPDETVAGPMTQAWQSVLERLRKEMPRASFETWACDTVATHFENNVLRIAANNSYARDWLESRMTGTVERLLLGVCNAEVKVQFVASKAEAI